MKSLFQNLVIILASTLFLVIAMLQTIIKHYHSKLDLVSEKSSPKERNRPRLTSLKLLPELIRLLVNGQNIYFCLDRVNLEKLNEFYDVSYYFSESKDYVDLRDLVYTLRFFLAFFSAPFAIVYTILSTKKLDLSFAKTTALATGDFIFCLVVKFLLNRFKGHVTFAGCIMPDAAIFMEKFNCVEVSHGVIHPGHPNFSGLTSRFLPIVVPNQKYAETIRADGCNCEIIVDKRYFRTFFKFAADADEVFIAQAGHSFEKEAEIFLNSNPKLKVRFHPRNSLEFRTMFRTVSYDGENVAKLYTISSTLIEDAQLENIPYQIVYSRNSQYEEEFRFSRSGLNI